MPRQSPTKLSKAKEAARLRSLRKTLGLNQREMALEFGVSHAAIGWWEREERTIPGPALKLLAIFEEKLATKKKEES
jgi:DNA-binding transcriptional regulator YiaG